MTPESNFHIKNEKATCATMEGDQSKKSQRKLTIRTKKLGFETGDQKIKITSTVRPRVHLSLIFII